eukprot:s2667_g2.t1
MSSHLTSGGCKKRLKPHLNDLEPWNRQAPILSQHAYEACFVLHLEAMRKMLNRIGIATGILMEAVQQAIAVAMLENTSFEDLAKMAEEDKAWK